MDLGVIGNVCTEKSPFVTHEVLELPVQRNLSHGSASEPSNLEYAKHQRRNYRFLSRSNAVALGGFQLL